jgi:uncharacterized protein YhbP (UPF0306 family)
VSDEARDRILAFIAAHNTLTLATECRGKPWANALFYANDDFTLYFMSDPKTRHADHLKNNPHVAATVQDDQHDWRAIQGVQFEGTCHEITNPVEATRALTIYATKYPFIGELLRAPKEIDSAMAKARFYKLTPAWIRLIDNARGFGFKEEIHL